MSQDGHPLQESTGIRPETCYRYLASGDKYPTLQYDFRVSRNTIPEVCQAIVEE